MPEDRSSAGAHADHGLWPRLRSLFGAPAPDDTLRHQLEDVIDRHEDDPAPDAAGDLSPLERDMLRNLLHFGERDSGDVGVPRADIIAVPETTPFRALVAVFADAGHALFVDDAVRVNATLLNFLPTSVVRGVRP